MARNIPPPDLKKIADELFLHEKKMICQKILMLSKNNKLEWLEQEIGISKRQLNRIRSQSANISIYTMCVIKAAVQQLPMQVNENFENDKS